MKPVRLSESEVQTLSHDQDAIRNVILLGAPRHGKSVIQRCLAQHCEPSDSQSSNGLSLCWEGEGRRGVIRLGTALNDATGSSELRLYDGAVVVVDCTQSISAETKTLVLKAALERTALVFCLSKFDELLRRTSEEEAKQAIDSLVEELNVVAGVCSGPAAKKYSLEAGNMLLCSGLLEFALCFPTIPRERQSICECPETRIPTTDFLSSIALLRRALVEPHGFQQDSFSFVTPLFSALFDLIISQLPSPLACASSRSQLISSESILPELKVALTHSNPSGPLFVYLATKVWLKEGIFAVGRVFSGTIRTGTEVFIHKKEHPTLAYTVGALSYSLNALAKVTSVPAGNIMMMKQRHFDQLSGSVITDSPHASEFLSTTDVLTFTVKAKVEPYVPAALPQLIEGIRKTCEMSHVSYDGMGEPHYIMAADPWSLQQTITQLRTNVTCPLVVSESIPIYRETILSAMSETVLVKTPNRHNRFYCSAEPLPTSLAAELESEPHCLDSVSSWRHREVTVWPVCGGVNQLQDVTKGCTYFCEIAESVVNGFRYACRFGLLCEETLHGMRFKVEDVMMGSDSIHRGPGQIIGSVRRSTLGCQLLSSPALLEPLYRADIVTPSQFFGDICTFLVAKRAHLLHEELLVSPEMTQISTELSLSQVAGLQESLEILTRGQAFVKISVHRWRVVPGNALDPTSESGAIVASIRAQKGLRKEISQVSDLIDKL